MQQLLRRAGAAALAGALTASLCVAARPSASPDDCTCRHGGGPAAHAAAGCVCPVHGGHGGGHGGHGGGATKAGHCHGQGARPSCALAAGHPLPAGLLVALDALPRGTVGSPAAEPLRPDPAGEALGEAGPTLTPRDGPAPPTPPPRAPFRTA
jgi:hypothetical protein